MELLRWLNDIGRQDVALAGGKGANLGELRRAGFPVPDGFVVTAEAYLAAMAEAGVREDLALEAKTIDPGALAATSERLQAMVGSAPLPERLRAAVAQAYGELARRMATAAPLVAVRSSATAEDTAGTSFAGMHRTLTNTRGVDAVLAAISACWQSLFGERVLAYRLAQGIDEEPAIAVVVQAMVPAARSGVAFTADPATGDTGTLVIEGALGQGEVVVGGVVEPDTYTLSRSPLEVAQRAHRCQGVQGGRERSR